MYRIQIVEDDNVICKTLINHFEQWGFVAQGINDFKNVVSEFVAFSPHLIIMDIGLPYFNGYHFCQTIRNISQVPIVFLSSSCDNMNIVMALSMGGDDFIAKPFDLQILLAKVQAILRRTYEFNTQSNLLEYKNIMLNQNDFSLLYEDQKSILSKNEFKIMQLLMESPAKIVTRETIIASLWQSDAFIDDNTLSVNMARIRKKLEDINLYNFIITKKGIGYMVE